ncbi:MAG: hypothetical protein WKG00_41565 [Polyangiaceae bacterium]
MLVGFGEPGRILNRGGLVGRHVVRALDGGGGLATRRRIVGRARRLVLGRRRRAELRVLLLAVVVLGQVGLLLALVV